ncbi:hypothetical protein HDU91_007326 [Kappamyces sp. JEL0680]|nr:hypothetical protein HDU91_007326 [Kappamyces sp. JEL0680]
MASAGLSSSESEARNLTYGLNQLSPPKKDHPIVQFLKFLAGIFNLLLLICGIVAYIVYAIDPVNNASNVYIGAILLIVAFLNAYIEFYQTQKSQAILESFMNLIPAQCYVIRDGATKQVATSKLTMGDVVYIRAGDKIPADLVLFACTDLKVDNSSLTGEAEPQVRTVHNALRNPLEASNLVFNGTLAVNGDGYGVVVRTGDRTVIGQIAYMTSTEERRFSPMSQEIDHFVLVVGIFAGIVTLVFFLVAKLSKGLDWATTINFAIGTFTGFVPQGLPATVTILLTLAAKRMSQRNVLVKDLQGVETLGAITLLATDKTGTLTRNQMTVAYIWSGAKLFLAQAPAGGPNAEMLDASLPAPSELLHMSLLCSRARFESNVGPVGTRVVLGDATEAALLRCAAQKLVDWEKALDRFPKVFEVPFNSENKWALTIHRKEHATGALMLYLKGAPERVLSLCSTFHDGTGIVPMTKEFKTAFGDMYKLMASKGQRVLAFAALALSGDAFPATFEFKRDPANYPKVPICFNRRKT